ncbi:MAG: hypothetical protein QOD44_4082 [Solirubrobacteraceae bacterium]|nr:hypothetical protein [Solirubrobacteraceae bacterium]
MAALVAALLLGALPAPVFAQSRPDAAQARAHAREILRERRFRGSGVPRPFAGVLRWLGDRLQPVSDFIDDLGGRVPGGPPVVFLVLSALVLLAAAGLARGSIRRRAAATVRAARARAPARDDPAALEREADQAAANGEWEAAVRLRFRAGLLRLDARELIEYRPSLTTGEVAAAVGSPTFERVGADFDAIAYGGRAADRDDEAASREGWQRVLSEAR